jgi:phage gpG-like protein
MPYVIETEALLARLDEIETAGVAAARPCAEAMAAVGEQAIKMNLSLSSHPRGTKTPAPPGAPPALISGTLRRSVRRTRSYASGLGEWTAHVAPTVVYARIQELGGRAGRDHRSYLPPRPYVRPAIIASTLRARSAAIRVFRERTGL